MKRKLFSKMAAMAMATVLVFGSNSLAASATENNPLVDIGKEATLPAGETADPEDENARSSNGKAYAELDTTLGQESFKVVGDDDATTAEATDDTTDISIWAKVVEHGYVVYKVDISWGAMKFEFNNQSGKWNTTTHEYDDTGETTAKWTEEGFINGTNNQITVVNHSNAAVNATFNYAHVENAFNAAPDSDDAVRGHFFLDNAKAIEASKQLKGTNVAIEGELDEALMLGHQDASNPIGYGGGSVLENEAGSHTRKVYFTFNGTPDIGALGDDIKTDFTKVGVITVTIAPTNGQ